MRGIYGYFATLISMIGGIFLLLYISGSNSEVNSNLLFMIVGAILLAGFVGGFVAPYHIKTNAFKSVLTIVIIFGSLMVVTYFGFSSQIGTTADPIADLALGLIMIIFLVVLGVILLFGTMAILFGGIIGSIFGKMFFDREQFPDLDTEFIAKGYG